jgi:pantothenate synthetase
MSSRLDHFKGVRGLDVWKLFGIVSTKFAAYFGEELATFSHVVDFFPTEI